MKCDAFLTTIKPLQIRHYFIHGTYEDKEREKKLF